VYQIYPRSFMDSNGDGVGDLQGIRARLDHLAWLGVEAIWLSPIFPSPMADFGYDVADYCEIDPVFGTLADFDRLLAEAHARGIRVILDWVPNHTSERHAWFVESRASLASAKRDWYVWRDSGPDGGPPNNWQSIFGGSAWQLDAATGQYYLHSFLVEQPDLNWRNPELVRAMHGTLRFWLERGVDGFRIDVIHRIAKDPLLRDNPPSDRPGPGYGGQRHVHDENHPDVHALLRGIRALLDEYPERMSVGEVYIMDPSQVAAYYGRGDELHLAFNFSFLRSKWDAETFARETAEFDALVPVEGWPDVVLSNHDVARHATRYDDPLLGDARARLAALLLLTLRGTPFLYYGEEIGMRNVEISPERVRDPLARTLHPSLSRDPERTPMQWDAGPNAGFTTGEPWLPIAPDGAQRNIEAQRADRASLLWLYRDLLALRRDTPALERGSWRALDAAKGVFAYERHHGASRAIVALNFTGNAVAPGLPDARLLGGIRTQAGTPLPANASSLELGPSEAAVLIVDA
jgi:alpha-glucosidase